MPILTTFLAATVLYASIGMLYLGILAWRKRRVSRDPMLAVLLWSITWWGLAYAAEVLAGDVNAQYFWTRMKYLGIVLAPLAMLGFTSEYTRSRLRLSHRKHWWLFLIPVVTLIGVWTDPYHHLFYSATWTGEFGRLRTVHGPLFWVHTAYSYLLLVFSTLLLARAYLRSGRAYRRQNRAVLLAALVPWVANGIYITGYSPVPGFDLTPAAFLVSGFLIYLAVFHFGLLGVSPVARSVLVDHMADGMLVLDLEDRILDINPAMANWFGIDIIESAGRRISDIFPEAVGREIDRSQLLTGQAEIVTQAQGSEVIFEAVSTLVEDGRRKPLARLLLLRDITERKRIEVAEREQRELAEVFRDIASVLNSTVDLETVLDLVLTNIGRVVPHDAAHVILLDDEGQILHQRLIGYTREEETQVMQIAEWAAGQKSRLERIMKTGQVIVRDARVQSRFGTLEVFQRLPSILDVPIRFQDRLIGMLTLTRAVQGFYTDTHAARLRVFADQAAVAIENARLYGEVQLLTLTDELTQLYNYRGLIELGNREFDRARRFERPLSVMFFDVDHFRSFNNRYTHTVGNLVLQTVARSVLNCLRAVDLPVRYGGEEFVVLLPETDLATAVLVAERIRRSVAGTEVVTQYGRLSITISVGVAELTKSVPSLTALIEQANHAEHHAKQDGRNCVVTYPRNFLKRSAGKDQDNWEI